jgi:arylsulfatase A-like enzyme
MGYPFRATDCNELKQQMAAHFALITMIDDAIGDIIEEVKAQGELDNTVVVYTADHGDFAGEHGLTQKNLGIYDSIHRIPLIITGPEIPQGEVRRMLVESVDLYPTLAELAGVEAEPGMDGSSRVAELNGEGNGTDSVVCEWEFLKPQSLVHAICDERWRLVMYEEVPDDGELYDRINDPGELENRFADPELAGVRERLLEKLAVFRVGTRRVHSWLDDSAVIEQFLNMPTIRLHQQGAKWSELEAEAEPVLA